MLTSPSTDAHPAMISPVGRRQKCVPRLDGDATVVLAIGGTDLVSWPLAGSSRPDLDLIDTLARQALTARRLGGAIRLRGAGPELVDLIRLVGLDDVVVVEPV